MIFGGQLHIFWKLTSHSDKFLYQGDTSARAEIYHDRLEACGKLVQSSPARVGRQYELGHHAYVVILGGQQHFFRKRSSHLVEFCYQGDTSARAETYHDRLQACDKLV